MLLKKGCLFIFGFLCLLNYVNGQNLTGTWEGELDSDEFIQINIIQTGDKVCGYTYDYTLGNRSSFCRAYFSGEYDKANKTWFLTGTSFMQNSGSHVLMLLKFRIFNSGREEVMSGFCRAMGNIESSPMRLRKVSEVPAMITQTMRDCVAKSNPPEPDMPKTPPVEKKPVAPVPPKKPDLPVQKPSVPPVVRKPTTTPPPKKVIPLPPVVPKKPAAIKPPVAIKPAAPKVKETVKIAPPVVVKPVPKTVPLPEETAGRKNKEVGRIVVNDKSVTLNVYDNGTVDGDTVSIFYNGRLILNRKKLSGNPITLDLILDENTNLHSIVLFAHNLGSIPPNTALVVITTPSRKRFELFSSATLQQNAEIVFEYVPK